MAPIYFMHTIFRASPDEIKLFIENRLDEQGKEMWLGDIGLHIYERKDYQFTWWFTEGGNPGTKDKGPFISKIDIVANLTRSLENTEVKIVLSHELLIFYFAKLAFALWDYFPIADGDLQLPVLEEKPVFWSAAGYQKEMDDDFAHFKELMGNDEKSKASKKIEKRGRSKYTDQEKIDALSAWDNLDPKKDKTTLIEFLDKRFGTTRNGYLNVPEQTFFSWRKQMKKKGLFQ